MADAEVPTKTQTEWRDMGLRNASNRNPDMDVGQDSYAWVHYSTLGEMLAVQSQAARLLSRAIPLEQMTEAQVTTAYQGIVPRQGESYATGYVQISCSTSGTTIQVGDELTYDSTKQRYKTSISTNTTYANGEYCPVISVDPGKGVNVSPGESLTWSSVRPGCYASALVWTDPQDSTKGLSGGRDQESLDEWKARISDNKANPAGHGNEQDVITLIEDISGRTLSTGDVTTGHGMPVRKGFAYPALMGPGTIGMAFTVKQDDWWRSRCPSSTQITTVYTYVDAALPKDTILPITLQDEDLSVDVSVTLNSRSAQWADYTPWPSAGTRGSGRKVIGTVTSATSFTIVTDDADYTGETAPVAGNVIGLFDSSTGTFKRKKFLTVTGTGPWTITVDTTAGASDNSFLPVATQVVSPWCDVLNEIATAVGTHIAGFGPGECVTADPGDGVRRLRVPLVTDGTYPITPGQRSAFDLVNSVSAVSGAAFLSASPTTTTVSGIDLANILLLTDLGVFKA